MTKKVKGFDNNASVIAKNGGYSLEEAHAILAAKTRQASPAAKRKNSDLKRVKMPKK